MRYNKKRFFIIVIALLVLWIACHYVANYYSLERIIRIGVKVVELKDEKSERITVEQAREIIGGYKAADKLEEITSEEVFSKTGYQLFKDERDRTYVIKKNTAYKIGQQYGGYGVMDTCVADLNNDGKPELIYTYSYGSGYHRSQIGMMILGEEGHNIDSSLECGGNLYLEKIDNQCVLVKLYDRGVRGKIVGTLKINKVPEGNTEGEVLDVILRWHLPYDIKSRISYNR